MAKYLCNPFSLSLSLRDCQHACPADAHRRSLSLSLPLPLNPTLDLHHVHEEGMQEPV